jgi:DNA-binding NarL/FixJ family response regulator
MTRIRLLLLDSHSVMRTALQHLLEALGHHIVGASGDVQQGVMLATRLQPDIVLMESRFPQGDAMGACRDIVHALPATRVMFLTGAEDSVLRVAGIRAGAEAYLHKETRVEELVRAIGMVARGAPAIDVGAARFLHGQCGPAQPLALGELAALTPQERRILPLVGQGLTNRQIGATLGLSHKTVKNHLSSVFQKLQVSRRAQLAALVARDRHPGQTAQAE